MQDALIYCCKDRDKDSFSILVQELKSIDKKYLSLLGNSNPLVYNLKMNYYTLSVILYLKKTNIMNDVKMSIIVPIYKAELFIERCVRDN